ncbi:QueT transporter family protein [Candidatus Enterococcus ikei]|uniref:QueT transporter family protein n=1 Tax=Candidatus Enterococcus ikei TaxID=2815326 RepID=A0ABS3GX10_9ENTE|nr:QueT transporter family protein [Enterococcus sp. DIV0869a]MBO0439804.1 QueT transporter family protein [Enterococcus sp. DIV0869a]
MNNPNSQTQSWSVVTLTKMALIMALYVIVTIFLAPFSFGAIQLRFSEMFNYLPLFNKRYIVAVTLGVAISNFASPLGLVDVIIGSVSTCLILLFSYYVTKRLKNQIKKMVLTAILCSFSMFTVAGQLTYFYHLPFFYTWLTVALGELLSMTIGGILIYWINEKIDLTK